MKTIILWKAARARTWKMQGLATAEGSAATIHHMIEGARAKRGRLAIVEASTASAARDLLKSSEHAVMVSREDGRVIGIGVTALQALAGTAHALANWDLRIETQGAVTREQSRAIRSDVDPNQFVTPGAVMGGESPLVPAIPGCTYRENLQHDGIEIVFNGRPEARVTSMLKAEGFRWHGVKKCWYAKRSSERKLLAVALMSKGGPA
jgi:hypothetical protein